MFSLDSGLQVVSWGLNCDRQLWTVLVVRFVVSQVNLGHETTDASSSDGRVHRQPALQEVSLGLLVELVPCRGERGRGREVDHRNWVF